MGVYINMEMPKNCGICPFCVPEADEDRGDICVLCGQFPLAKDEKSCECPLAPVPPHGRLIDKDALEADISASVVFSGREGNAEIIGAKKIINRLHVAPTIIPAEEGE